MGGNLTLNGDVGQETYKFAQAGNGVRFLNKNDWAEGYNTGESMGGNLTINGDVGQETYKFAQK